MHTADAAGKKATAKDLVKNARSAVASIGMGMKEGKLDPKQKGIAPFAKSLKALRSTLSDAEKKLAAKDKGVTAAVAKASEEVRTLEVTFSHSGIKADKVAKGVAAATDSVARLHKTILGETARKGASDPKTLEKKQS